ncbi:hypothetical protein GGS20DRAFT_551216 [Poronia punctata]|nr:hypothetical protein GGS20DRAFT_551216 [Poronia punctata]
MHQQRRSHKKSRRGCLNCKKWHTKCDEQGPPCNNCRLRNAKCEYAWARTDSSPSPSVTSKGQSPSGSEGQALSQPTTLVTTESRRMLELDLMHCWSTSTYKGNCIVPEDEHYLQSIVPQEALRYDFLLNGIFVAAALHRASMTQGSEAKSYYNVAMELYDRASRSFRTHLDKMNPETHHVLYMYSSMTAFFNIAFSQCNFSEGDEMNTLCSTAVAFDLVNGSINIAETNYQMLLDSPIPIRAYIKHGRGVAANLDYETHSALARLASLNEVYHNRHFHTSISTPTSTTSSDELSMVNTPHSDSRSTTSSMSATPWTAVVALLRKCFAEEQCGIRRGYCFAFPGRDGADFTAALRRADPMALLILLHWSVVVDRVHLEYWWTRNLGRRLAVGALRAMRLYPPKSPLPALLTPEWGESISWACKELRLS